MKNDVVYVLKENVEYEVVDGFVFLIKRQNHPIQNFLRKIKIHIPKISKVELDEYASFVFLQINGKNTVEDIGNKLDAQYHEAAHPLYERLMPFLAYLFDSLKIIKIKEWEHGKI